MTDAHTGGVFKVQRQEKGELFTIVNENGYVVAEKVLEADAKFIVRACNFVRLLKQLTLMA